MKRLELESLRADLSEVESLLRMLDTEDELGRLSLSSRQEQLQSEIARWTSEPERTASVALLFGGEPVMGSRAISADFATRAIGSFQGLVDRKLALENIGALGSRGPIPAHRSSDLAITDIVRGSMGFVLEEWGANSEIADTVVKSVVSKTARLIADASGTDEAVFEQAIEAVDPRVLISLKEFFSTLDDAHATVRILESDEEANLDMSAVHRGRVRVDATEISESESDTAVVELLGVLPDSRRFEFRFKGTSEILKGSVAPDLARSYLSMIESGEAKVVGQFWRVKLRIREVRERNRMPRQVYTLLGLLQDMEQPDSN